MSFPRIDFECTDLIALDYAVPPHALQSQLPRALLPVLQDGQALLRVMSFGVEKIRPLGSSLLGRLLSPALPSARVIVLSALARRDDSPDVGLVLLRGVTSRHNLAQAVRLLTRIRMAHALISLTDERSANRRKQVVALYDAVEANWRKTSWYGLLRGRLNRMGGMLAPAPDEFSPLLPAWCMPIHTRGRVALPLAITPFAPPQPLAQPYLLCNLTAVFGSPYETALNQRPRAAFYSARASVRLGAPFRFKSSEPEKTR